MIELITYLLKLPKITERIAMVWIKVPDLSSEIGIGTELVKMEGLPLIPKEKQEK